jgi:N-terminal domain of toast_rack, DUF2154
MDQATPRRRGSFAGPIILIGLGVIFLMFTIYPDFNPWPALFRYWPLILILLGLGKIWDSYYARHYTDQGAPPPAPFMSGTGVAWILLLVFFIWAAWHAGPRGHDGEWPGRWAWHGRTFADYAHDTQAVDLQGAKTVDINLDIPAGQLTLSGGAGRLMDADFKYDRYEGKPNVDYSVSGGRGQLRVTQDENNWHTHWGTEDNEWNLRVANDVPIDLNVQVGAGQTELRLNSVDLKNLDVHMGAGQLDLDLTGARKNNVDGTIEGGVGQATIRLPKDVGVHVEATGGIGAVDVSGLHRDGDAYVNDVYGKAATNVDLTIHGGVGEIRLVAE